MVQDVSLRLRRLLSSRFVTYSKNVLSTLRSDETTNAAIPVFGGAETPPALWRRGVQPGGKTDPVFPPSSPEEGLEDEVRRSAPASLIEGGGGRRPTEGVRLSLLAKRNAVSLHNMAEGINIVMTVFSHIFFTISSAQNASILCAFRRMYQANSFRHAPRATSPEGGGLENEAHRRRAVGYSSISFIHRPETASLGMRQSPRGEKDTCVTLGPSGMQERLNC